VLRGRMPVTKALPYQWYDTPNIRVSTFTDFEVLARKNGLRIIESFGLNGATVNNLWPNLTAATAVFKFERG
jgi:methionine biosynthesis protein MetW